MNLFAKLYLIILSGFFFFGTLSCYFLTELWQLSNIDYVKSLKIYLIVVLIIYLTNLKTHGVSTQKLDEIRISPNYFGAMTIFWFLSIIIAYLIAVFELKIPLGHVFNIYTVLFPGAAIIAKRPKLGYLALGLLLFLHVITANRVYLSSGLIIFLLAKSRTHDAKIIKGMILIAVLVISVSFIKVEDEGGSFEPLELASNMSSKIGSEWRDGIILNDALSDQQKEMGRLSYVQSILTIVPLHSIIGITTYQDYYPNLVSTTLLHETNLASLGYTGIRTGLIWEAEILYGYYGVVIYSLVCGILLRSCWLMNKGIDGFIISNGLFIALVYSQIGMINFIIGVYLSALILICIIQFFLKTIIIRKI